MEGKTCFCGVTEYLNIKSVLYRQTHNAVCYIECSVLRKHSLADVGKIVSGDLHKKKHLILSQQRTSETMKHWLLLNSVKWMYFVNYQTYVAAAYSFKPCANQVNVCHHCTTVANTFRRQKQSYSKHTLLDLVRVTVLSFNTSHYVSDFVYSGNHEELYWKVGPLIVWHHLIRNVWIGRRIRLQLLGASDSSLRHSSSHELNWH